MQDAAFPELLAIQRLSFIHYPDPSMWSAVGFVMIRLARRSTTVHVTENDLGKKGKLYKAVEFRCIGILRFEQLD